MCVVCYLVLRPFCEPNRILISERLAFTFVTYTELQRITRKQLKDNLGVRNLINYSRYNSSIELFVNEVDSEIKSNAY